MIKTHRFRIGLIILCATALIGYALPAINVELSFLGMSRTYGFSIATVFDRADGTAGPLDINQSDISDLFGDNDMMEGVAGRIGFSVGAYFAVLLIVLLTLAFIILGRLKLTRIGLLALALALYIAAGHAILTVPGMVAESLTGLLGFFAMFLNVSEMLQISLGVGYWVTIIALAGMLLAEAMGYLIGKITSGKSRQT